MGKSRERAKAARKAKAKVKTAPKWSDAPSEEHLDRFNQLLDDAIFGVRKKNQRG